MSEWKNGDRVRLSNGSAELVGVSHGRSGDYHHVTVDGSVNRTAFHSIDWRIEVIEPTTLDKVKALKPGAVIHNGKEYSTLAVKTQSGGWYFIYSEGATPAPVSEKVLADFIDTSNWEIKYEGHEVT